MIAALLVSVAGVCDASFSASNADGQEGPHAPIIENRKEATQYGVTWTFDKEVPAGQFVNGDNYVVGPVTVVKIDPAPIDGRNGSILNLNPRRGKSGFDSR